MESALNEINDESRSESTDNITLLTKDLPDFASDLEDENQYCNCDIAAKLKKKFVIYLDILKKRVVILQEI